MENLGNTKLLNTGNLPFPYVITAPLFISEPVAGNVITVPNGNGFGTISTGTSGTPAFITSITGPS